MQLTLEQAAATTIKVGSALSIVRVASPLSPVQRVLVDQAIDSVLALRRSLVREYQRQSQIKVVKVISNTTPTQPQPLQEA